MPDGCWGRIVGNSSPTMSQITEQAKTRQGSELAVTLPQFVQNPRFLANDSRGFHPAAGAARLSMRIQGSSDCAATISPRPEIANCYATEA